MHNSSQEAALALAKGLLRFQYAAANLAAAQQEFYSGVGEVATARDFQEQAEDIRLMRTDMRSLQFTEYAYVSEWLTAMHRLEKATYRTETSERVKGELLAMMRQAIAYLGDLPLAESEEN